MKLLATERNCWPSAFARVVARLRTDGRRTYVVGLNEKILHSPLKDVL